jgi:TetR/AcrR family transcriptional repressor of nem operon
VIFQSWKDRFADCLVQAQIKGEIPSQLDPQVIAEFILAGWEGAILRAKVMKSPESIQNFIDTLFATVLRNP